MPRAFFHDYRSRSYYHITLSKSEAIPAFSLIHGSATRPIVNLSPLGEIIEGSIHRFPEFNPHIRIDQYVIMPDHIHLLLFVMERIEKALGSYIGRFKTDIRRECGIDSIFQRDFHDRIIRPCHSLQDVYDYIRDNPRRLLIRREHPEYFTHVRNLIINGDDWEAYGNLQLLRNPFKSAVVIHRRDTAQERERNRQNWLYHAANGGVNVSAFISEAEKEVRAMIEAVHGKQIRIQNESFGEKFKPASHEFQLCERGELLLLAPANTIPFSRSACLQMNAIAEGLAANSLPIRFNRL